MKFVSLLLLLFTPIAAAFGQAGPPGNTKNVILITLDGARTQEVFGGLDLEVLKSKTKKGSVEETPLYKKYYAETPEERREKLMPFFWGALMKQHGSIAGNRSLGSEAMTTRNEMPFSEKHDTIPNRWSATPARSGPMTRARLNWIELSAIAFGRWSVLTSEGMSD